MEGRCTKYDLGLSLSRSRKSRGGAEFSDLFLPHCIVAENRRAANERWSFLRTCSLSLRLGGLESPGSALRVSVSRPCCVSMGVLPGPIHSPTLRVVQKEDVRFSLLIPLLHRRQHLYVPYDHASHGSWVV